MSSSRLLFDRSSMSGERTINFFSLFSLSTGRNEMQNAGADHAGDGRYYYTRQLDCEQSSRDPFSCLSSDGLRDT